MKIAILTVLIFLPFSFVVSQTLDKNFPSTDNTIAATLLSGDTLYIGGDFTYVYTPARGLARFVNGSIKPDATYPQLGGSDYIQAVEPDGVGGLYLAGYFDTYNGIALPNTTAVIHLLDDGKLDPAFGRVNDNNGYTISALKRKGSRLYIGGTFTPANIPGRNYFAALDALTGGLLPWIPDFPDGYVSKIDATDSLVFLGGSFANVGNIPNNYFAVLKASNGQLIKNFPRSDYNYTNSFAVDGNTLYVAGPFTVLQNTVRSLAKVDTTSGSLDLNYPFTDGYIYAIYNDGTGGYYIGGSFNRVGKENRTNLAHILSNGTVDTAFNPNVNGQVNCITASADTLYFGGSFSIVNTKTRNNAAAVSRTRGILATWNPNANGAVNAITIYGNTIYLGGSFTKLGTPIRNYAGAIGINNVLSTTWIPNPDSYVLSMVVNSSGSAIYLGGSFSTVKTQTRSYAAKVNTTNGDPLLWYPQLNSTVYCMALSGSNLYLGGAFSTVNNIQRYNIAAIDTSSSLLNSFQADANGIVRDIKIYNGKIYVAGDFTTIQGLVRSYAARFNVATGIADNWLNGAKINSYIFALGYSNSEVILGGQFTSYNPIPRPYMAAIDLSQPNYPLTNWTPNVFWSSFSTLNGFIHNGHDLIIAGTFVYQENGKTINNLIILNDSTGTISQSISQYPNNVIRHISLYNNSLALTGDFTGFVNVSDGSAYSNVSYLSAYDLNTWQASKTNYYPDNSIYKIFTDPNGRLIVAGSFNRMNNISRNRLAAIDINSGLVTDFNPSADGSIYALAIKDTTLFAGGTFGNLNSNTTPVVRTYLGAVSTKTGKATAWNANANSSIYTLAIKDSILYAGGSFTTFKGAARNYGAAITTSGTGTVNGWLPNTNGAIWIILPHNNTLFIGGDFSTVKGVSLNYLAQVNNSTGAPNSWNPSPNGSVYSFDRIGNKFYAGGSFYTMGTTPRLSLASFDTATKSLTTFDANVNGSASIQSVIGWGKNLIVRGQSLSNINGADRQYLGAIDSISKLATSFNPSPNYSSYVGAKLMIGKNKLFYGSGFTQLYNNPISPNYFAVFNLEPLNQVSALTFTNLTPTSVKASVTRGSGDGRIFVVRRGNSLPNNPVDSMWYTGNSTFGNGSKIGDSSYVVYRGGLDSITTILLPNKKYQFAVFEYNGNGIGADYLTSPALTGFVTTPCPVYNLKTTPADSVRICPGTTITITAPSGFSSYLWNTGETTAAITKGVGAYTVVFTDSNGCAGNAVVNVQAFIKPNLGKDTTYRVCVGTTANLTTLYNTSGYSTVIWSTPRPDSVGAGKDTLIVINSSGCRDTAVITVVINPKPNLGKDTTVSICVGFTTNIRKLYDTTGYVSKVWSASKPDSATAGNYTLIVTNSSGCKDTANITVVNYPKPYLGRDTGYSICNGSTTNLTTLYNTTGYTVVWNTPTPVTAGAGNYTLIVTNTNGCKDTALVSVTTNPKPNLGKDTTYKICRNNSANLTTLYSTGGYSTVVWSTSRPDSVGVGNYSVIVSNSFGCTDTALIRIDSIAGYTISATATSTNAGCFGGAFGSISVLPANGVSPYKYKNGLSGIYQSSNLFKSLRAGVYTIYIQDSNRCSGNTAPVTITELPRITATFTKTNATCIGKADGTITVSATGGRPPYQYKIGLSGVYKDGPTLTGLKAGTYTVYIKDLAGCTGSTSVVTIGQNNVTCLQIAGNIKVKQTTTSGLKLTLSPNPSSSEFILFVHSEKNQSIQVRVLDVNGRGKFETIGMPERNFHFGNNFNNGTYLIEVRQGEEIKTIKAVKLK